MRYLAAGIVLLLLLVCSCDIIASTQLEQAVVKALAGDGRTKSGSFEVSHHGGGRVLITGEVDNDEMKAAVGEVARAVEGVTSVINQCSLPEHDSGLMQDTVVTPYL